MADIEWYSNAGQLEGDPSTLLTSRISGTWHRLMLQ